MPFRGSDEGVRHARDVRGAPRGVKPDSGIACTRTRSVGGERDVLRRGIRDRIVTAWRTIRRTAEARVVDPVLPGALVLAVLYTALYLAHPSLPGNRGDEPLGWWGWFDQSQYIRSARHLGARDLAAGAHWYPLGYALLAAPFTRLMPIHPFFFVDLAALLAAYAGFVSFARLVSVPAPVGVLLFLLTGAASSRIALSWVEPWNSTASAGAIWLLLALTAAQLAATDDETPRRRLGRLAAIGLLGTAIVAIRPTDAFIPVLWVGGAALRAVLSGRARWADAAALGAGAGVVAIPFAILYLAIYGPQPSEYMRHSRTLGFAFAELPWKIVILLLQPRPWFPTGAALAARLPWLVPSFAGMVPAVLAARGATRLALALLASSIGLYWALFFSYIDLLPPGLWRYRNIHYFKWTWPGLGLFAFLWLRALAGPARKVAIASLAVVFLLMCVRLTPILVAESAPARMIQFAAGSRDWHDVYFGDYRLADSAGEMTNVADMRGMPDASGLRVIALRRPFAGAVRFVDSHAARAIEPGPPLRRWAARVGLGYPCWLPPYPCRWLARADK